MFNKNLTKNQNKLVELAHSVSKSRTTDPQYRAWLDTPGNRFIIGKKHANARGTFFVIFATNFTRYYVAE